jgi:hypothetical protein
MYSKIDISIINLLNRRLKLVDVYILAWDSINQVFTIIKKRKQKSNWHLTRGKTNMVFCLRYRAS